MEPTRFTTTLREHVRRKIELLRETDIVVGVPAYYSAPYIVHVIQTIIKGLNEYYPGYRALVMISDGGSTDDTREVANLVTVDSFHINKIVTIYRGMPGKGTGLKAIFEAADFLKAKAVAVFDSDLISITPEWIKNVLEPIFLGYDYVAPDYRRYKLDGTITNTIAYNLTRALYGCRIRQPIGGDFGISAPLVRRYLQEEVWETDVARFGIDIWMTTTAIVEGYRICQTRLGAKIHGEKDPTADLGPMFRQVVGTTFQLMDQNERYWRNVTGSQPVPSFGVYTGSQPKEFIIDHDALIDYFRTGYRNFRGVWRNVIMEGDYEIIRQLARNGARDRFRMPIETWVRMVYCYAGAFHATPRQRFKLLDTLIPLYYGRVASLVNELKDKDGDAAEEHFETQAFMFETLKDHLRAVWTRKEIRNG